MNRAELRQVAEYARSDGEYIVYDATCNKYEVQMRGVLTPEYVLALLDALDLAEQALEIEVGKEPYSRLAPKALAAIRALDEVK